MDNLKEVIERWKILGKIFINNNSKVFIKELNGDLHFCYIKIIEDDYIIVDNFGPEQRRNKKDEKIYWAEIKRFEEYLK